MDAKLVGLVEFSDGVVQDEVDRYPTFAAVHAGSHPDAGGAGHDVCHLLRHPDGQGHSDVAAVERAFEKVVPPGATVQDHVTSLVAAKSDRAIKPESIALGVFGGSPPWWPSSSAVRPSPASSGPGRVELEVLRALGAGPWPPMSDGVAGRPRRGRSSGRCSAASGGRRTVAARPDRPVRPVYPDRGFAFDWTVLGGVWRS